jgi:hypothetical protein
MHVLSLGTQNVTLFGKRFFLCPWIEAGDLEMRSSWLRGEPQSPARCLYRRKEGGHEREERPWEDGAGLGGGWGWVWGMGSPWEPPEVA